MPAQGKDSEHNGLIVTFGLLVFVVVGHLILVGGSMEPSQPSYRSGARPVSGSMNDASRFHAGTKEHAWVVRRRMESTFEVVSAFGDGRVDDLQGVLRVVVPDRCADRTVHWRISADGERIGGGLLKWLRKYDVPTRLTIDGKPDEITVEAWWDGGTANCPFFTLVWQRPRLYRDADYNILDPDFYH
ncbi:hypothetical protein [Streptomyces aurantiacus]|uniref:hypothetical protein n=1 Tax=Streptomyces aurantiacus TaxID=47760 RepID=UPI000B1B19ED|nr:hypothetical protein [Streptomyces aurantiacus]